MWKNRYMISSVLRIYFNLAMSLLLSFAYVVNINIYFHKIRKSDDSIIKGSTVLVITLNLLVVLQSFY